MAFVHGLLTHLDEEYSTLAHCPIQIITACCKHQNDFCPCMHRTEGACTLWELDAAEVMVLFKQWPLMWMKLQQAARTSFFARVAHWPRPWPPSLAIELEVLLVSCTHGVPWVTVQLAMHA